MTKTISIYLIMFCLTDTLIIFRETARGGGEGELSGGEQEERRRSGETDGIETNAFEKKYILFLTRSFVQG